MDNGCKTYEQATLEMIWLGTQRRFNFDSEDKYRSGCRKVIHQQQQLLSTTVLFRSTMTQTMILILTHTRPPTSV